MIVKKQFVIMFIYLVLLAQKPFRLQIHWSGRQANHVLTPKRMYCHYCFPQDRSFSIHSLRGVKMWIFRLLKAARQESATQNKRLWLELSHRSPELQIMTYPFLYLWIFRVAYKPTVTITMAAITTNVIPIVKFIPRSLFSLAMRPKSIQSRLLNHQTYVQAEKALPKGNRRLPYQAILRKTRSLPKVVYPSCLYLNLVFVRCPISP